jgi:hypothetical protein
MIQPLHHAGSNLINTLPILKAEFPAKGLSHCLMLTCPWVIRRYHWCNLSSNIWNASKHDKDKMQRYQLINAQSRLLFQYTLNRFKQYSCIASDFSDRKSLSTINHFNQSNLILFSAGLTCAIAVDSSFKNMWLLRQQLQLNGLSLLFLCHIQIFTGVSVFAVICLLRCYEAFTSILSLMCRRFGCCKPFAWDWRHNWNCNCSIRYISLCIYLKADHLFSYISSSKLIIISSQTHQLYL